MLLQSSDTYEYKTYLLIKSVYLRICTCKSGGRMHLAAPTDSWHWQADISRGFRKEHEHEWPNDGLCFL